MNFTKSTQDLQTVNQGCERERLTPGTHAVGNGGSAALRGVTPADLGNGDAVELHAEHQ